MKPATATDLRVNLRYNRAQSLMAGILRAIEPHLRDDVRLDDVCHEIVKMLHDAGAEVLTDHDRQMAGLQPRDDHGWTPEELIALERHRLEIMLRSRFFVAPGPL